MTAIEQRREMAAELRKSGHSERAIAGVVGVSQKTIHYDLKASGDTGVSPDRTTGKDGKSYPAQKPRTKSTTPRLTIKAVQRLLEPELAFSSPCAAGFLGGPARTAARRRVPGLWRHPVSRGRSWSRRGRSPAGCSGPLARAGAQPTNEWRL